MEALINFNFTKFIINSDLHCQFKQMSQLVHSSTYQSRKITIQSTFKQQTQIRAPQTILQNKSVKEKQPSDSVSVGEDDFMSFNAEDDQQIDKSFNNAFSQPKSLQNLQIDFAQFKIAQNSKQKDQQQSKTQKNRDSFDFEQFGSADFQISNQNTIMSVQKAEQFNFDQFTSVKNDSNEFQKSFTSLKNFEQGKQEVTFSNFQNFQQLSQMRQSNITLKSESQRTKQIKRSKINQKESLNFDQFQSVKRDSLQNSFTSQVSNRINENVICQNNQQFSNLPSNQNSKQRNKFTLKKQSQNYNLDQFVQARKQQKKVEKSFSSQVPKFQKDKKQYIAIQGRMSELQVSHNQSNKKDQINVENMYLFNNQGRQSQNLQQKRISEQSERKSLRSIDSAFIKAKQSLNFDQFGSVGNDSNQFEKSFASQISRKPQILTKQKIQKINPPNPNANSQNQQILVKNSSWQIPKIIEPITQKIPERKFYDGKQSLNFDQFGSVHNDSKQFEKSFNSQFSRQQKQDSFKFEQANPNNNLKKSQFEFSQNFKDKKQAKDQKKIGFFQIVQQKVSFNFDQFRSSLNSHQNQKSFRSQASYPAQNFDEFEQKFDSQLHSSKLTQKSNLSKHTKGQNILIPQLKQPFSSQFGHEKAQLQVQNISESQISKRNNLKQGPKQNNQSRIQKTLQKSHDSFNFDQFGSINNNQQTFQRSFTQQQMQVKHDQEFKFDQFDQISQSRMEQSQLSYKDKQLQKQKQEAAEQIEIKSQTSKESFNFDQFGSVKNDSNIFQKSIASKESQKTFEELKKIKLSDSGQNKQYKKTQHQFSDSQFFQNINQKKQTNRMNSKQLTGRVKLQQSELQLQRRSQQFHKFNIQNLSQSQLSHSSFFKRSSNQYNIQYVESNQAAKKNNLAIQNGKNLENMGQKQQKYQAFEPNKSQQQFKLAKQANKKLVLEQNKLHQITDNAGNKLKSAQEFDFAEFEQAKSQGNLFENSFLSQMKQRQEVKQVQKIQLKYAKNDILQDEHNNPFALERRSLNFDEFGSVKDQSKQFQKSFTSQIQKQGGTQFNFDQFNSVSQSQAENSQVFNDSKVLSRVQHENTLVDLKKSLDFDQFGSVIHDSKYFQKSFTSQLPQEQYKIKNLSHFQSNPDSNSNIKQVIKLHQSQQNQINDMVRFQTATRQQKGDTIIEKKYQTIKGQTKQQKHDQNYHLIQQQQVNYKSPQVAYRYQSQKLRSKRQNSQILQNRNISQNIIQEKTKSFIPQRFQNKHQQLNFDQFNGLDNSDAKKSNKSKQYSKNSSKQQIVNFEQFGSIRKDQKQFDKSFSSKASKQNSKQFNFNQFNSVSQSQMRQSQISKKSKVSLKSAKSKENEFNKARESLNFDQFGSVNNDSKQFEKSFASQIQEHKQKQIAQVKFQQFQIPIKPQKDQIQNPFDRKDRESLNFEQFGSVKNNSMQFQRSFTSDAVDKNGQQFNFDQFKSVIQSQIRDSQITKKSKSSAKSYKGEQNPFENPFNIPNQSFNFDQFKSVVQSDGKSIKSQNSQIQANFQAEKQKPSLGFDDFGSVNQSRSQLSQNSFSEIDKQSIPKQVQRNIKRQSQANNFDDFASKHSSSSNKSSNIFKINQQPNYQNQIRNLEVVNISKKKSNKGDKNEINFDDFASQHSSSKVSKQSFGFQNFNQVQNNSKQFRNSLNSQIAKVNKDQINFGDFSSYHSSKSGFSKKSFDMFDNFDQIKKSQNNSNRPEKSQIKISEVVLHDIQTNKQKISTNKQQKVQNGLQMFQSVNSKNSDISSSKNNESFKPVSSKSQKQYSYHKSNQNILDGIVSVQNLKSQSTIKPRIQQQFKQFEKLSKSSQKSSSRQQSRSQREQEKNIQRYNYQQQIKQKAPKSLKKLNQLYGKLCNQSDGLNQVTKQSHNYAKLQKQRLSLFKNQLHGIRQQILNAAEIQTSQLDDSSFMSDADIRSVVKKLQIYKESQNKSILGLIQKINKIQQLISILLIKIEEKRQKKKADPFYKVYSPLQVAKCFKKDNINKVLIAQTEIPVQKVNEIGKFQKFYINEKFMGQSSYKKLFAPKQVIINKASSLEISLDYCLQNTQSRRVLRITIGVQNNSNSVLRQVRVSSIQQGNVISIKPSRVYMMELRPKQRVHQMIYVGAFNPDMYFVPVQISYVSDSGANRYMKFPVSLDIMKFVQFERRNIKFDDVQFKSVRSLRVKNKSQLSFFKQGDDRVLRMGVMNELQRVQVHEIVNESGCYLEIKSSSSNTLICQKLAEYFRFMYD